MPPLLLLLLAGQALTFSQAMELAEQTPALAAEIEAAERRSELSSEVSSLSFNPVVQLQPGGRVMRAGGQGVELSVSLSQRFSLGGLADQRRTAMRRELEHDHALRALVRRHARRDVAEAWFARFIAQRALAIAHEEIALADQLTAQTRAVVAVQEATSVELATVQSWRAEVALSALSMEGDAYDAGLNLAIALGQRADGPRAVVDELPAFELPAEAELAASAARVEATPAVALARAEQAATAAHLEEMRASRAPTMALGAMGWREGGGDLALVATLEAEIPLFEAGERDRSVLAAEAARAEGRQDIAIVSAQAERARLLHEVRHTQAVASVAQSELLVAAEALAEAQRVRLAAHEATVGEWVIARRGVVAARLVVLRAQADHLRTRFLTSEAWSTHAPETKP